MIEIPPIFGIVLGIITLLSGGASAVAILKSNLLKSSIEVLRQNNDDLKERVELQKEELALYVAQAKTDNARIAALERENETLRGLASGSTAVEELAKTLTVTDKARQGEHYDIIAAVQTMSTVFTRSHEELLEALKK